MNNNLTCKTCKYLLPIYIEPNNFLVNSASELLGYACTLFADSQLDSNSNKLIFKKDDNGTCSCHSVGNKVTIDDWS